MIGPGSNQISIVWHISDVQDLCPLLSDDEAMEVLTECDHRHDANIGINWDVIDMRIQLLFPEKWEEANGIV